MSLKAIKDSVEHLNLHNAIYIDAAAAVPFSQPEGGRVAFAGEPGDVFELR